MNLPGVTTMRLACRRRRRFVAGISAATLFALAAPSDGLASGAGGSDVQWEEPSECLDANSVKPYVERLLGRPFETGRGQPVSAQARVHRNSLGNCELRLSLSEGKRSEEATLAAKECRAVADATALKTALASDPMTVVE